jgi:hypothetical protein
MARISADFTNARVFSNIPEGTVVNGRVTARTTEGSVADGDLRHVLTWTIIGGEFAGRELRFDSIYVAGTDRNSNPIPPRRLADLINATGMPCAISEGESYGPHTFVVRDGYICDSATGAPVKIYYDDDNFLGLSCQLVIGIRKTKGSDKEYNNIKSYQRA